MPAHIVKTNKIGEKNSNWAGRVAYRVADLNIAWNAGKDLDCYVADVYPKHMIIPHDEIYTRINHRRIMDDARYGKYELAYYIWHPTHEGKRIIKDEVFESTVKMRKPNLLF